MKVLDPIVFEGFPKIPRLSRDCVVTEKIDGTNASIHIPKDGKMVQVETQEGDVKLVPFLCASKKHWIFPGKKDNFGFASWAYANALGLLEALGPGSHYGEWYGRGIQRTYGLQERRWALFNTARWKGIEGTSGGLVTCVPTLGEFEFDTDKILMLLAAMQMIGSQAVPGFMRPEGVVVFHKASGYLFKKTMEHDEKGKN